jgi:hypothetical protein
MLMLHQRYVYYTQLTTQLYQNHWRRCCQLRRGGIQAQHSRCLLLTTPLLTLPFFSSHSFLLSPHSSFLFFHTRLFSSHSFFLQDGKTALFVSACNGHDEVVTLLLHNRVETNTVDTVCLHFITALTTHVTAIPTRTICLNVM